MEEIKQILLALADFRPFDQQGLKGTGAEIGVCKGIHARMMLRQNPGIKKLYLIDPYKPYSELYRHGFNKVFARLLLRPYRSRCVFLYHTSAILPKLEKLDFCYIDGAHDYESIIDDINNVWPRINPGGVMGGHDFGDLADVDKAVKDFCEVNSLAYATRKTDWWIFKP